MAFICVKFGAELLNMLKVTSRKTK